MSRKRGGTLSHDWHVLRVQLSKAKPQPMPLPVELPLGKIRMWPNVFQHRRTGGHEGAGHIRKMIAAIDVRKGRMLDPMTVWWDGKAWACVDGHHRHAAYMGASVGRSHAVPVEVFEGSLAEAMGHAASANSKDKLAMSSGEKSDAAWRMVAVADMSRADAASASGVSESTVANMRRVRLQLEARASAVDDMTVMSGVDYRDLSWADARRLAAGTRAVDFDWDAANEVKAQEMAVALKRALGKEGGKYPEILARALEIYDTRLVDQLVELWNWKTEVADEDAPDVGATAL